MPKTETTVTKASLRANRKNARKSTGPRTPEGKARSSRNALKHGLLARHVILDEDPNEDPAEFNQILEGLITDFAPDNTIERLLVERIAASYWRLRRAFRYETQAIRDCRDNAAHPLQQLSSQILGANTDPTSQVLPNEAALNKLIRYESMIDRELNRAIRHLRQLQSTPTESPSSPNPQISDSESPPPSQSPSPTSQISNLKSSPPIQSSPPPSPSAPSHVSRPPSLPPPHPQGRLRLSAHPNNATPRHTFSRSHLPTFPPSHLPPSPPTRRRQTNPSQARDASRHCLPTTSSRSPRSLHPHSSPCLHRPPLASGPRRRAQLTPSRPAR